MSDFSNPNTKRLGGINQRPTGPQINVRPSANTFVPPNQQSNGVIPKTIGGGTPTPGKTLANSYGQTQSVPSVASPQRTVSQPQYGSEITTFISSMKDMVGSFAYISDDVVANNAKLASGNGMTIDDRKIPFECAQYIMANFAFICMGLVFDADFKDAFVHAVTAEQNIDALLDDEKKTIRASMTDPTPYPSEGHIVLGMTSFTQPIEDQLHREMMAGFDKLEPYANEFDEAVRGLTDQQKIENGFVFSNWMYLIRAFTHNDMFMSYVITVIDKVKTSIGIQ